MWWFRIVGVIARIRFAFPSNSWWVAPFCFTNGQPCSAETLWDSIEIRAEKLVPVKIPIREASDEPVAAPR